MPSFFRGAFKDDPPEIYNWKIYILTATSCMGGFLYGYDSGVMGGVLALTSFKRSFNLLGLSAVDLSNHSANIVAMLQAGAFFGSLGVGPVADKIGRRPCLIIGSTIFIVGSIMQVCAAPHIGLLMGGRVVGGFGVGACSTLAPLYTSENVPRAVRGRLTACYQLFIQVGLLISFWINYGMSINYPSTKAGQWQVSLALQILPGVILILGMFFLSESPRHLYRVGKPDQALKVLSWTRSLPADHPYVKEEAREVQLQLENEGLLASGTSHFTLWRELFVIKSNRNRLALGLMTMLLQQMMGVNAINYYSPQIFQNLGLKGTNNSLFATGIYGVVKVCSSLIFALFIADRFGRRKSLILGGIEQALCLFYVGAFVKLKPSIFLYIIGFEAGWGPVPWIYNAEIHSARLRGTALGAAAATNWLFNFVVSRATPVMLTTMGVGGYGTFLFYGSFCVICVVFAWFFCPETKGMSLEAMDEFFGNPVVCDAEHGVRREIDGSGEKNDVEEIEHKE
uniref:Major facilitator superfamily (MFS) profile domain-containing protein n=1 Tax=Cryptococcus bacillisporus CA1280 TaxID=1296109 RepID=A0A0D0VE31_CRYGA|nr:hypothetical protein I312_05138 [Cryptococcus bacillisporus CA1280]